MTDLDAEIRKLRQQIRDLEIRLAAKERDLLEDGLRLSQENEVLRREIERLRTSNG